MGFLIAIGALVLLALGTPIFAVFLGLAAYGATQTSRIGFEDFAGYFQDVIELGTGKPAEILSTIPLFIFAGFLMAESKTADRIVKASRAGIGFLPGGLAIVTIAACAVFTTFTGASGVTIVALGGLLMPALLKERYPERFSLGLVAGTGSVGLLFPPAVPLFVYGTVYGFAAQSAAASEGGSTMKVIEFSTDRFLTAGIVPGLVLLGILMIYSMFVAKKQHVPRHPFDIRELGRSLLIALPELLIPFAIIGAIIFGGLQIFEAAALTVVYVFVIEVFLYKDLKVQALWRISRDALSLVGAIFIIMFAAQAFTSFLVTAEVPQKLVGWISETFESKWAFMIGLNVLLLMVGMLMDIFSAIVVVVPLIAPAAEAMGIDPYHLGVIFLLNLEIGYLTPPVGLNLFITGFTFKRPIVEVIRASFPFLLCMIAALMLITYIPALTVVKDKERRGYVGEYQRQVRAAYQKLTAIDEIALPDGTVMTPEDCKAIEDTMAKTDCNGLFIDVTKCRTAAGGQKGSQCETDAIAGYLERSKSAGEEDDWGFEDEEEGGDDLGDEDETGDGGGDILDELEGGAGDEAGEEDADEDDWGDE